MPPKSERVRRKADPDHIEQVGAMLPRRLTKALEIIADLQNFRAEAGTPKVSRSDIVKLMLEQAVVSHPDYGYIQTELEMHFAAEAEIQALRDSARLQD